MERYWSPVEMFISSPVPTVGLTSPKVVRMIFSRTRVILCSIRLAIMTAPKIIAQSINQMVFSIPLIPPVATSALTASFPVSIWVEVLNMIMVPLSICQNGVRFSPAICWSTCGCIISAHPAARREDTNNVMRGGMRLIMRIAVKTGTTKVHGLI